jgi:DNA modification methylase
MLTILQGDCLERLRELPAESVDACITDPPYELTSARPGGRYLATKGKVMKGFMGMAWDGTGISYDPRVWAQVWRVLKPGGHLLAFGGTRTYHRIVCAIEDAGFEIRDQIGWVFGSGFPKSRNISKAIDRAKGVERKVLSEGKPVKRMIPGADQNKDGWIKDNGREFIPTETEPASEEAKQWEGWGTALKPAWEPIVVARKPFKGTVESNVLKHGAGAINIDACRVELFPDDPLQDGVKHDGKAIDTGDADTAWGFKAVDRAPGLGRWPANLIHDGSEEVLELFAEFGSNKGAAAPVRGTEPTTNGFSGTVAFSGQRGRVNQEATFRGDTGTAARFFYCAKARGEDRKGNTHPTVKPTALMRYLCRLVTPPGGIILDPFAGSGSTGVAARLEGFSAILIEKEHEHFETIRRRLGL